MSRARYLIAVLSLALISSCATPARVTTPDERAYAHSLVTNGETLVLGFYKAGELRQVDYDRAVGIITTLRAEIDNSATVPIGWDNLIQRALNLAIEFIPAKDPKK